MKGLTRILVLLLVFMMLASTFVSCGRRGSNDDEDDSVISQRDRNRDRDEDEDEDDERTTPRATPEMTPEATPKPTPEETPEETPEATPMLTPEATPAPTPSAGSNVSVDDALGVIEGSTYTNAYFGFTIELPESWYKASREELSMIMNMTASYISDQSGQSLDLAVAQLLPLFYSADGNPFTGGGGSNIVCLGQNIKDIIAFIPDLSTLMQVNLQGLTMQGIESSFSDVEMVNLGGQDFAKVMGYTKQMGITVYQGMYVTMINDYMLNFTIAGYSEEELLQVDEIMYTISFR